MGRLTEDEFDDLVNKLQADVDAKDKQDFSEHALKLGTNPYHKGIPESYSVTGKWRGPCGDEITWYLETDNNHIISAYFTTDGCNTSSMAGSQTALLIEGKDINKVREITDEDVLKALGKFPEDSWHCATVATTSLRITLDSLKQ